MKISLSLSALFIFAFCSVAMAKNWTWTMPQNNTQAPAEKHNSAKFPYKKVVKEETIPTLETNESASVPTLSSQVSEQELENIIQKAMENGGVIDEESLKKLSNAEALSDNTDNNILDTSDNNMELNNPSLANEFDLIDTNKNGYITKDEFFDYQQKGLNSGNDNTFEVLDTDHNGKISEQELSSLLKLNKDYNALDLDAKMNDIDLNKDGYISPDELRHFRLKNINTMQERIFNLVDENKDNKISRSELENFMNMSNEIYKTLPIDN